MQGVPPQAPAPPASVGPWPLFFRVPKVTSRRPQTLRSAFGQATASLSEAMQPLEAVASACTSFLYRVPKVTSRRPQTLRSAFGQATASLSEAMQPLEAVTSDRASFL